MKNLLRIVNSFTGVVEGEWIIEGIDDIKKGLRSNNALRTPMLENEAKHFTEMITEGKEKYIPCISKVYFVIRI